MEDSRSFMSKMTFSRTTPTRSLLTSSECACSWFFSQLHSTVLYALVLSSLRGENRVVSVNLSFLSLYPHDTVEWRGVLTRWQAVVSQMYRFGALISFKSQSTAVHVTVRDKRNAWA